MCPPRALVADGEARAGGRVAGDSLVEDVGADHAVDEGDVESAEGGGEGQGIAPVGAGREVDGEDLLELNGQ